MWLYTEGCIHAHLVSVREGKGSEQLVWITSGVGQKGGLASERTPELFICGVNSTLGFYESGYMTLVRFKTTEKSIC